MQKSLFIEDIFGIFEGLFAGWVDYVLVVVFHNSLHEFEKGISYF